MTFHATRAEAEAELAELGPDAAESGIYPVTVGPGRRGAAELANLVAELTGFNES